MNQTELKEIEFLIRQNRPKAKFIKAVHSSSSIQDEINPEDRHYVYVSLYDENINSNYLADQDLRILVSNTYAGSFIYNNILSYYYCNKIYDNNPEERDKTLRLLLDYKFKKILC